MNWRNSSSRWNPLIEMLEEEPEESEEAEEES
jgi:hypothetical protein